jgi:hypothetical protein
MVGERRNKRVGTSSPGVRDLSHEPMAEVEEGGLGGGRASDDELGAWREQLGKGPAEARAGVFQRIDCWLSDPDLACLRDPAPLGRLPAAEREEWEKLWRERRELRASAPSTKEG